MGRISRVRRRHTRSGIDASRLAEELNALLEQGRIVTWLDRNSEYADDLDTVQELLDDATLITINANLFETKLRIFAEDTKSRYAPFFKSSARVADLKKHLAGIADADKRSDRKTFLAAMSAVLLKTQQRSFSVLFAKLATASSVDGNDPLKALKWGLDTYFWEGAHAIWGYEGEHTFDALMTWLFVMNARGWDYRHNSAQRDFSTWTHDVATRDDARRWAKQVDEVTGASSALHDAAEIQIRDPYLRKPHQIRNVHEILLLLIQHADAARLPHVVIETCASDEDEYRAKQEATFEQLQQSWGQFGIVIDWSIVDDFHDRSIVTDTGWVIDLGRGLDVYESFTWSSPFDPRITLPHLRRTKEITINVSRDTEGHA